MGLGSSKRHDEIKAVLAILEEVDGRMDEVSIALAKISYMVDNSPESVREEWLKGLNKFKEEADAPVKNRPLHRQE